MNQNEINEFVAHYEAYFGEFPVENKMSMKIWNSKLHGLKGSDIDKLMDLVVRNMGEKMGKPRLKDFIKAMKDFRTVPLSSICAPCGGLGYLRVNENTVIPCLCPKGESVVKSSGLTFPMAIREQKFEEARVKYMNKGRDPMDEIPKPEDYKNMMKDIVKIADSKMTLEQFHKKWDLEDVSEEIPF